MEKLKTKLKTYEEALQSFDKLLQAKLEGLDPVILDGVKNGQIQKFEYCTELTWKLIKKFLYKVDGVDVKSPKESLKEFFLKGHLLEKDYKRLMQMIEDRNALSHLYSEDEFKAILQTLPTYCQLMKEILKEIQTKMPA